jgi:hypothetical protein
MESDYLIESDSATLAVPTIVPETRQNSVSRANASQLAPISKVDNSEGIARKNEDGRNADRRLANRRLQPLGHLTARLQVYGNDTDAETLGEERLKATHIQTVAVAVNCNYASALCRRLTTGLGTVLWGTFPGTDGERSARVGVGPWTSMS